MLTAFYVKLLSGMEFWCWQVAEKNEAACQPSANIHYISVDLL